MEILIVLISQYGFLFGIINGINDTVMEILIA